MKKIGLIGGLSYLSTLEYYRRINAMVRERCGGYASAPLVLESLDEAEFLAAMYTDPSEDACARLVADAVAGVVERGAQVVALCAVGVHRFVPRLRAILPAFDLESSTFTLVHIAEATAQAVVQRGVSPVGLLGVEKTMTGAFFRDALAQAGVAVHVPDDAARREIHAVITEELVLGTFTPTSAERVRAVGKTLLRGGAQALILGCTELPLLLPEPTLEGAPILSTTEIHCRAVVDAALR